MKKQNDLHTLRKEYEEYSILCECAMRTILARIENINVEMKNKHGFSFLIFHRLKTFESLIKKMEDRGYELSIESIKKNVFDVAGIRIVTDFPDEIEIVKKAVLRQPSLFVSKEKDYINNPKENGYKSVHLNLETDIYFGEANLRPPVELQIRDQAMDLWARLEHRIHYKSDVYSPECEKIFKEASERLMQFSASAVCLRDTIKSLEEETEEI